MTNEPKNLQEAFDQKRISDLYYELIFAVGNKYPGESRHETALRYIQEAETPISRYSQDFSYGDESGNH